LICLVTGQGFSGGMCNEDVFLLLHHFCCCWATFLALSTHSEYEEIFVLSTCLTKIFDSTCHRQEEEIFMGKTF
jgi:hypothetical protein